MASRDDSRVVFVGNIPYDGTEQQLAEQFSEVGTVVSFRLVNDRETGKPKGFGFCEYKDAETARSAIRNLNGINFHGRPLRVDTADDDQAGSHFGRGMQGTPAPAAGGPAGAPPSVAKERMGVDAIGAVVDSLSNEQQCEVLSQMKQLIASDPDGARRLLHENQQLAQAMLRILVIFDAVKPEDIQSLSAVTVPPIAPPAEVDLVHRFPDCHLLTHVAVPARAAAPSRAVRHGPAASSASAASVRSTSAAACVPRGTAAPRAPAPTDAIAPAAEGAAAPGRRGRTLIAAAPRLIVSLDDHDDVPGAAGDAVARDATAGRRSSPADGRRWTPGGPGPASWRVHGRPAAPTALLTYTATVAILHTPACSS